MFSDKCPICQSQLFGYPYFNDQFCYTCNNCQYQITFDEDTGHLYSEYFIIDSYFIINYFIVQECVISTWGLLTNINKIPTTLTMYIGPTISLEKLKSYIIMT